MELYKDLNKQIQELLEEKNSLENKINYNQMQETEINSLNRTISRYKHNLEDQGCGWDMKKKLSDMRELFFVVYLLMLFITFGFAIVFLLPYYLIYRSISGDLREGIKYYFSEETQDRIEELLNLIESTKDKKNELQRQISTFDSEKIAEQIKEIDIKISSREIDIRSLCNLNCIVLEQLPNENQPEKVCTKAMRKENIGF